MTYDATIYFNDGTATVHTKLLDDATALRKAFKDKLRIEIEGRNSIGLIDMALVHNIVLLPSDTEKQG